MQREKGLDKGEGKEREREGGKEGVRESKKWRVREIVFWGSVEGGLNRLVVGEESKRESE